jgi:hypothetical protein
MFELAAVNWLAVVVAAVASFILGGLWYSVLFSKPWMRLSGITQEQIDAGAGNMALNYAGAFVMYLIAVAVLALVMQAAGVVGAGQGLLLGLLIGAGIVATVSFNNYVVFGGRPLGLFLIDYGYPVTALALSGVILGVWQ